MKRKLERHSNHTKLEKSVSEDLKESRSRLLLSEVIDFLPDAILAIDRDGKVITWNKAMEKMTGAYATDMIGKGDYEYALPFYGIRRPILVDLVLMHQDEVEGKYDSVQREGNTLTVEIFIPTFGTNGSYLWAKAAPLYDFHGETVGAIESIRDITERKRGEEALIKSEQEKEAILSSLRNVAVEYLDPQMRIIWVNSAVQKSLDLSLQDLRGKYCYESIQGTVEPCPGCKAALTLQTGHSHEGELVTPDGKTWITRSNAIKGREGQIYGVVHVAMNISERKSAEKKIAEMKQRLADVIDFLPDATLAIDKQGTVITWNKAMEKMTGAYATDMIGKGDYEYALPFYGIRRPILADLILQGNEEIQKNYPYLQREGNTLLSEFFIPTFGSHGSHIWAKATPLFDSEGNIAGSIESMRDITDRKEAEEEAAAMKQRLAEVIDFLPDATLAIDKQGTVITWNKAMEKTTGAYATDMIGKGNYEYALPFYGIRRPILIDLVLNPDETIEKKYPDLQRDGKTLMSEIFIPTFGQTGSFIWAKAAPLYNSQGSIVGAIESIRDITDMRRTEQTLERSKSELRIASDIQKSFLPERIPHVSGFDLAATTIPAREVGGDFYDFIIQGENLQFVIADVSGKGVPAALFMALSRTIVRACATDHDRAAERLSNANNMIVADSRSVTSGMFVTLFFASLNKEDRSLVYANAGHNPPLLFRAATTTIETMKVTGVALGMRPDIEYEQRHDTLEPGDIMLLYTDGIVEAMNDKEDLFGLNRLRTSLAAATKLSAQGIMDSILRDLRQFTKGEEQSDDITAIVIKAED